MASEWRELPFSEAVLINPPVRLERGNRYPFVDMGAVSPGARYVYATDEREFFGGGSRFQHGDTLMARITPCLENGKIARFCAREGSRVGYGSTEFIVIRGRPSVTDTEFAYYLTHWEEVRSYAVGQMTGTSGRQRVPTDALNHLTVPVPPLSEQRAIAHILGTLDDKIELNRRMSETLEAIARALFKSWFVDFDPVRAKMEGRDPGLPKTIADLFPDCLVDSELGEIPEGWEVAALRQLSSYLSRGIGPAYVDDGGVCVLNQKCVRDRRINFLQAKRHDPSKRSIEGRTLQLLDVIVNSTGVGTLGRVAQVWDLSESTIVDSHVTVIRAASDVDPWFLGVNLIGRENEVEALGEGSTGQTELSRERLGLLPCVAPPVELQKAFGRFAAPLLSRVSVNERESRTLAALRDTLLPKLISGEIRVKDAERLVLESVPNIERRAK
ncbi:MAG: restriction endonuclease subunit S [Candidatus Bipolaricaulis sp.]|nr:restriction endonuclease subunit S [Candidatus Bipolaricaulis sp.]